MRKSASIDADVLAYRVGDACRVSGLGKTSIYDLVAKGRLERVRIGGRTLITAASLRRLLTPEQPSS